MSNRALGMALFCLVSAAACGTRQPAEEVPPPAPVPAGSASCDDPVVGENVEVTSSIGEASSPVIAYDGESFRVAWWDMRGQYPAVSAVRIDRAGERKGEVSTPPHKGAARDQTIAADSAEAHLVWLDEGAVQSARLRDECSAPVEIAEKATYAAAGPRGAVAWVDRGVLLFRADGMRPPPDRRGRIADFEPTAVYGGGIEEPRIAWNGERYAAVWSSSVPGGRNIMLQRLSNSGARLGNPVVVSRTAGVSRNPEIAAIGDGFAVVWTNAAPEDQNPRERYRIFFALVGETGDSPLLTRQLEFNGSADHVSIAAAGDELGLAWVGSNEQQGSAVFFARLDRSGKPLGRTVHVSDGWPLTCGRPAVAFAGDGYGVVWHDDRDEAGSKVMYAFLSCGGAVGGNADAGAAPGNVMILDLPEQKPVEATPETPKDDTPKLKKLFQ